MDVQPRELPYREFYRLLITTVAPRPIAWVSSMSRDGTHNLAPFSFFNVLCATPPLVGFCPGNRSRDLRESLGTGYKDTLRNVRDTGEFVVNIVTYPLREQMNLTSGDYEASVDEFEIAKLRMRPSKMVKPPHVAASPINYECKLFQILDFGTEASGGSLVIGEIVSIHIDESVMSNGRVDGELLDLIGRMGGAQYCRATDRFDLIRPERKVGTNTQG
jgi:flavin reductase (DIM6/NTAB) family NADH-FMN oxidoreductase RutF